jgi:flagella basal body P-ring formation protein FlgA
MMIATLYLAAVSAAECHVVNDDMIRIRDLSAFEPAFSTIDGDRTVAYAPLPGSIRMMKPSELARLAKRDGIEVSDFHDLCFQRAMRRLGEPELLEACRLALGMPAAEVELVDYSRFPAPVGQLVFPRSGLALAAASAPSLWKGYVIYGGGQHFPIWVRVRLHARLNRVIATDNLITSQAVRADQVRIEPLDGFPDALAPAQSLDEVVGKKLLRPVRRGATVSLDDVANALSVRRGDKVDVEYRTPVVHLHFEAAAEMDGRIGDPIRLRNPQSGNSFVAEVSGKDQARVVETDEIDRAGASARAISGTCGAGGQKEKGCE